MSHQVIVDYSLWVRRVFDSLPVEQAVRIRRGIDTLREHPRHHASRPVRGDVSLREVMVEEGVCIRYMILENPSRIYVTEMSVLSGYLNEDH